MDNGVIIVGVEAVVDLVAATAVGDGVGVVVID